jgi:hypothetical protein
MQELELSLGFLQAIEQGKITLAAGLLAEDMLFSGPVSHPVGKIAFVELLAAIRGGIPNWRAHFRGVIVDQPFVRMTIQVSGAHLRPLGRLLPGMPYHHPTGESFQLPPQLIEFEIRENKIHRIYVEPVDGGWIEGMLDQLKIVILAQN